MSDDLEILEKSDNYDESEQKSNYENLENSDNLAETERLPLMARLLAVFTSPGRLAASLRQKPDFLVPLLISTLMTLLYTWTSLPAIRQMIMADPKMAQIPEEQLATVLKIQGITTMVGGALSIVIVSLVGALVLHLVAKMMKGQGRFAHAFSIISYSSLIGALGALVRMAMLLVIPGADFLRVQTSLAVLLPDADLKSPLYMFLAQMDLFSIWSLIFVAIAFSVCYGLSAKKGYLLAFIPWGLYVAATSLLAGIFQ